VGGWWGSDPVSATNRGCEDQQSGVATEGCVRPCAQARAGVGSAPTRKKKDQAVPNHITLIP
jgi:hypothetical protein